jgi:hypothetical protein
MRVRIVPVLRIVQIQRTADSTQTDPRYDIVDSGQFGEESGVAAVTHSLLGHEVGNWLAQEGVPFSSVTSILKELSETGSVQVSVEPRLGPRIVRAWFDTVLNPLIGSVEFELGLLTKRNWTFSFAPPMLELIRPTKSYLRSDAESNLEQVAELNLPVAANIQTHDVATETLLNSVIALHSALISNDQFVDLCNSLLAPENLLDLGIEDIRFVFGAYPASDRIKLLGQNVVNNLGELPPHFATAKFWNRHRKSLLQALAYPNVREHDSSTAQIAAHLASVSKTLLNQVKDLRSRLSLRYDVPYVRTSRDKLTA